MNHQLGFNLNCHHFWEFEGQHGKTSNGICKYCRQESKALNSFPESDYRDTDILNVKQIERTPMNNVDLLLTSKRRVTDGMLISMASDFIGY